MLMNAGMQRDCILQRCRRLHCFGGSVVGLRVALNGGTKEFTFVRGRSRAAWPGSVVDWILPIAVGRAGKGLLTFAGTQGIDTVAAFDPTLCHDSTANSDGSRV